MVRMAARSIGSGMITLGRVAIPVKVYTAQSAKSLSFNMLHEPCKSRLKQLLQCPVHDTFVERSETVKGFEFARDQYVYFTDDELKALDSTQTGRIAISEIVPLDTLSPLNVEKSFYLGPDKGGDRGFEVLRRALVAGNALAVGTFAKRGKDTLVAVRGVAAGVVLHECFYADEVRSLDDIERAPASVSEVELELARRLFRAMQSDAFDASKYKDTWAIRVRAAVDRKVAGDEFVVPPVVPGAQVLDLEEALRASIAAAPASKPRRRAERRARA